MEHSVTAQERIVKYERHRAQVPAKLNASYTGQGMSTSPAMCWTSFWVLPSQRMSMPRLFPLHHGFRLKTFDFGHAFACPRLVAASWRGMPRHSASPQRALCGDEAERGADCGLHGNADQGQLDRLLVGCATCKACIKVGRKFTNIRRTTAGESTKCAGKPKRCLVDHSCV